MILEFEVVELFRNVKFLGHLVQNFFFLLAIVVLGKIILSKLEAGVSLRKCHELFFLLGFKRLLKLGLFVALVAEVEYFDKVDSWVLDFRFGLPASFTDNGLACFALVHFHWDLLADIANQICNCGVRLKIFGVPLILDFFGFSEANIKTLRLFKYFLHM